MALDQVSGVPAGVLRVISDGFLAPIRAFAKGAYTIFRKHMTSGTVRPKKYAHGYVVLAAWLGLADRDAGCSVLVQMQWFYSPCGGLSHYKLWSCPLEQGPKLDKL